MKNCIRNILIIIFLMLSLYVKAQQNMLAHYITLAIDSSYWLQAKLYEYQASSEVVLSSAILPDPNISFQYFIQPIETRLGPQQMTASLSQTFPWFGLLKTKKHEAYQQTKIKYKIYEEERAKLCYQIASMYYHLYALYKERQGIADRLTLFESIRQLFVNDLSVGKRSAIENLELDISIENLKYDEVLIQREFHVFTRKFNNIICADLDAPIQLPDSLSMGGRLSHKLVLLDSIRQGNHMLLQFDMEDKRFDFTLKKNRKEGLPSFSLGIHYMNIGNSNNSSLDPSSNGKDAIAFPNIKMSIPLYRKKYKARVNHVAYLQQAHRMRKEHEKNNIENRFDEIYKKYENARSRVMLYTKQKRLLSESLSLLKSAYTTGKTNLENLLMIEQKILLYDTSLEKAKADYLTAIAYIHYLMGGEQAISN